jgi:adenylate cyclase
VVLGYALTFDGPASTPSPCLLHPLNAAIVRPPEADDLSPFFRASGAICTLPVLERAARASGFLNATADADGILRRVPLIMELDGRLYPGLALAAVMAEAPTRAVTVRVENGNALQLSIDDRIVPLDGRGNMRLRYRGGKRTFRYVSAADVLAERAPADAFRGALVFVGATALGAREVVATPLDTHVPGVEIQATAADNLLQEDFIHRSQYAATVETAFALLAALAVLLVARAGLGWGSAGAAVCLLLLWRGSLWRLSTAGEFLSPLFPALGVIAALVATTVTKFLVERRRAEHAGRKTEMSQRLLVQSLLSLTAARDPATGQHACRTQRYTRLLAEQLASHPKFREYLTPERIDLIATLAPLHDIGKVAIPDCLLNKPGTLTREELVEMRKHPAYGRDVILQAERRAGAAGDDPMLVLAKEIVYTHHERWDGTGYPQGLVDEQIPIAGRLVALVDVFDALTTRRVYRPPLPVHTAIDLIVEERGKHFDPAVVDAFLKVAPVLRVASLEECLFS